MPCDGAHLSLLPFQVSQPQPLPPWVRFWRCRQPWHLLHGFLLCWPGLGNITGRGEKIVFISFHVSQDSVVVLIINLSTGNLLESGLKHLTLVSEQGVNSGADQSQVSAPKTGAVTGDSLKVCLSCAG